MSKTKKDDLAVKLAELTEDLQRTRADFENFRKRVEQEREQAREQGRVSAILKLLPVIDNIERAIAHLPDELADHQWAKGVASLAKNLDKSLEGLALKRIETRPGDRFDHELHEAISFDEDSEGEQEVIAEVLQPGYVLGDSVLRHAMVRVKRQ